MKAFGVEKYGPIDNFCEKDIPIPTDLAPRDILVLYVALAIHTPGRIDTYSTSESRLSQ